MKTPKTNHNPTHPCPIWRTVSGEPETENATTRSSRGLFAKDAGSRQLILFMIASAQLFLPPQLEAQLTVDFLAGSDTVLPGGSISIPVTSGASFTDVTSFQFSLSWNSSVFQYNSVSDLGMGASTGMFNLLPSNTSQGRLGLAWDPVSAGPESYPIGSTIFVLNLTAVGAAGTSSSLQFADLPTSRDVSVNFGPAVFGGQSGSLSVVPEPGGTALVFAMVLTLACLVHSRRSRRVLKALELFKT